MPAYIAHYRALAARLRGIADGSRVAPATTIDPATKAALLTLAARFEQLASEREAILTRASDN